MQQKAGVAGAAPAFLLHAEAHWIESRKLNSANQLGIAGLGRIDA